ncbi:MAG: hypothetical protein K0S47_1249 [Herbinix sp.]|nr:hypothetical protein [Herbinix sp.]
MKLYLKQRIFSLGDKYDIYDVNENTIFNVESELFSFGPKLHLYDSSGNELYYIKRRITFFLAQYEIYRHNDLCATIQQELTFFRKELSVESDHGQFAINGDFLSMDYTLTRNGAYFGSVQKKWLSWGDSYEIDIPDSEDAGFVCALVIAIDNCLHNDSNN